MKRLATMLPTLAIGRTAIQQAANLPRRQMGALIQGRVDVDELMIFPRRAEGMAMGALSEHVLIDGEPQDRAPVFR